MFWGVQEYVFKALQSAQMKALYMNNALLSFHLTMAKTHQKSTFLQKDTWTS